MTDHKALAERAAANGYDGTTHAVLHLADVVESAVDALRPKPSANASVRLPPKNRTEDLEQIIRAGLNHFLAVSGAIHDMRDTGRWKCRSSGATFENYLDETFGIQLVGGGYWQRIESPRGDS